MIMLFRFIDLVVTITQSIILFVIVNRLCHTLRVKCGKYLLPAAFVVLAYFWTWMIVDGTYKMTIQIILIVTLSLVFYKGSVFNIIASALMGLMIPAACESFTLIGVGLFADTISVNVSGIIFASLPVYMICILVNIIAALLLHFLLRNFCYQLRKNDFIVVLLFEFVTFLFINNSIVHFLMGEYNETLDLIIMLLSTAFMLLFLYLKNNYYLQEQEQKDKIQIAQLQQQFAYYQEKLKDRTVESWEFIDEFIEQTQYKERLIQLLAIRWPDMWNDIVQDISITYERKIFYLQLLIDNVDTERLFVLNDNNEMSGFIEENPDILQQLSSIQDQKVISLIETLGIVFTNVSIANVSEEILRYVFENQCYELNDTMIRRIVEFENDTMLSGLDTRNYTTIISLGYEPLIKYIQENLKQYVKEIILAPNNTKEDVEQIMDLLERMLENAPEETEICLELVNHEEFCVDDISECCGKFDSDFDKDVKILWDELLDKGKVSLKWENIKCYWDRYKITPELLQYIETNSDQLTFLENQCLNEVFAEELITSTIDDSAFEKLLPQLELEFDIPIEKVERQKVGILIKKKYIPFDVNKYGEIKDAYPDLCPDFILYNQAEYMEVMEKIPMGETLLETLLLSPILDFSNAEVLLDAFGENYMTAKIAENLVDSNVTINKSIFTAAWEYVDEKGKKTLMFKCLSILEAADFENCFSELSQWYSGFCDRSKKHSVELPNNEESQRLAKRLQEVSYITSYKLQEKEVYDSVTETKKKKSTFVCWIKAIKG